MSKTMTAVGCEGLNRSSSNHPKAVIFIGDAMRDSRGRFKKGHMKGEKLSTKHKLKIKLNHARYWLGKHWTKEMMEKIRRNGNFAKKGALHPAWRGGFTKEDQLFRMSIEYGLWRASIWARDNWTCQNCGKRGGRLNAHHIKPFVIYPELRTAIDNGITLCVKCHNKTKKGRGTKWDVTKCR